MRKQKSTVTLLALALVLAFGAVPVMAAEDTVPPTIPTVYPIEVHSSESGGVTMVWQYVGQLVFNMLILTGLVKGADRIVKEMLGL